MPKAKQEAAAKSKDQAETTKKAARTKPSAAAKKTAGVKKTVARKTAPKTKVATSRAKAKPVAKKPNAAAKKTVATKAAKSKTTVRATARRTAAPKAKAPKAKATAKPTRSAARRRGTVLDVPPAVIDTSLAAEVAAALVRQGQARTETLAQSTTPVAPPEVVKRGSSALRHVKESLANPISRQLDSVFGPLMTPQVSAFLNSKARRAARNQSASRKFDPHAGHFGVPRRAAG